MPPKSASQASKLSKQGRKKVSITSCWRIISLPHVRKSDTALGRVCQNMQAGSASSQMELLCSAELKAASGLKGPWCGRTSSLVINKRPIGWLAAPQSGRLDLTNDKSPWILDYVVQLLDFVLHLSGFLILEEAMRAEVGFEMEAYQRALLTGFS